MPLRLQPAPMQSPCSPLESACRRTVHCQTTTYAIVTTLEAPSDPVGLLLPSYRILRARNTSPPNRRRNPERQRRITTALRPYVFNTGRGLPSGRNLRDLLAWLQLLLDVVACDVAVVLVLALSRRRGQPRPPDIDGQAVPPPP